MKKAFLFLLLIPVFAACSEPGSTSTSTPPPTPPTYKDSLTFIENAVPTRALIHTDDALITDRPTRFKFLIENFTPNTYNNISFLLDPEDNEKYSITADKIEDGDCTSLEYNTGCIIEVDIATKTADDINFKIKMTSDRGEDIFSTTPIKTAHIFQPFPTALELFPRGQVATQTFFVMNMQSYGEREFPGSQLAGNYWQSGNVPSRVGYELSSVGNFTLNEAEGLREFSLTDGTKVMLNNCLAPTTSISNKINNVCYVDVTFVNTTSSDVILDTLTIKHRTINPDSKLIYKYAIVNLSVTN